MEQHRVIGGVKPYPLLTLILILPLTQHSPLSPSLTRWEEGIKRDMKSLRSSTTGREILEERLVAPVESGGPTANLRGYRATAALASPTPDPDEAPHRELYRRAHPCPCPSDSHLCYEYRCPPTLSTRHPASHHQPSPPTPHQEREPPVRWSSEPRPALCGGRGRHHSATRRSGRGTVRALQQRRQR